MNTILTDDEIRLIWLEVDALVASDFLRHARAIEAAVLAKLQEQQPVYVYIYEWDSELGIRLSLSPASWNGKLPKRSVPLYAARQPAVAPLPEHERQLIEGVLRGAAGFYAMIPAPAMAKQAYEALEAFKRAAPEAPNKEQR